jgi:hypothetical protein
LTDVRVSWNLVSGATSYRVYWSGAYNSDGGIEGEPTKTSFTSIGNDITHYFRVSAVTEAGEGAPSSWVSVGPVTASAPTPTPTPTPATAGDGGPTNWTRISNNPFGDYIISAVAWGGGRFVAVSNKGKMAYSTDGASWTAVSNSVLASLDGNGAIEAIAYGNGRFIAVGWDGMAYCDW